MVDREIEAIGKGNEDGTMRIMICHQGAIIEIMMALMMIICLTGGEGVEGFREEEGEDFPDKGNINTQMTLMKKISKK